MYKELTTVTSLKKEPFIPGGGGGGRGGGGGVLESIPLPHYFHLHPILS